MAQKSNQNQPGQEVGHVPEGSPEGNEFENAVTTEISDVLASAFGEDRATEPNDVHITDMQLAAHVDPAADDALPPGSVLNDRFEIVDLVHSGGMSLVYKAIDHRRRPEGSGEIHVAIKMMRPSIASDEEARLSLEREAAKAQSVSHPNIVNIFDFDDHEGRFFLVMEWLQGESVNSLLRRTRGEGLECDIAWPVIAGVAAAVRHAHQKNVVHADINPSNIFVTEDREIKLLDFGVARFTKHPDIPDDDRFAWVTKPYASPEVLSGLTPDFKDDVFSLACVAYRLLAGKHPFGGRLSLVAKHQGRTAEPIPGLADDEWRLLQRGLAYERSERPAKVTEFVLLGERNTGRDRSTRRRTPFDIPPQRLALIAATVLIMVTGGLWLLQRGGDSDIVPLTGPPSAAVPSTTGSFETPAVPITETLLATADRALADGQLVAPDDGNARTLFREVLLLEPDNAAALRGLRTISNAFVQQAHLALNADEPGQAYAALTVATETDPANPAIEMVNQLLVAKADSELADARLAVATGNLEIAARRLDRAEQYLSIDPAQVGSIRQQIEQIRQGDRLLERLAEADAHIAAGRLLSPEGDNAHALLLNLRDEHGIDARLLASMERLGERLLTRAAFAAAADSVADASELLDAVEVLGVLEPEVEAARTALAIVDTAPATEDTQLSPVADERTAPQAGDPQSPQLAEEGADPVLDVEETQLPQVAEEQTNAAAGVEEAQLPQVAEEQMNAATGVEESQSGQASEALVDTTPEAEAPQSPPAAAEQSGETLLAASAIEQPSPEGTGTQAVPDDTLPEPRRQSLRELGITEYVAPRYPGYAERQGISGEVEVEFVINADGSTDSVQVLRSEPSRVFEKSAANAVRKWRFQPREEALRAQVTLRFDYEP